MAVVEAEYLGQIMVIRLNRPERMNALGFELRSMMADAWNEFEESKKLEVAIVTGTGKAFCAGEDMKESVERGIAGKFPRHEKCRTTASAGRGIGLGVDFHEPARYGFYSRQTQRRA